MRFLLRIAALLAAVCVFSFVCSAEFVTDELYDALPDDAAEQLDESGITPAGGTADLSLGEIWDYVISTLTGNAGKPLSMFASLLAVILLSSLLSGISDTAGASHSRIYTLVTSASAAVIVSLYMSEILSAAIVTFEAASDFMLAYIPVIAGVTALSGHTSSAALFSTLTISAIQILSRIITSVIMPLTSCIIGITAAGSVDPDLSLDRLGEGIKKLVIWGLGLIMTVFLGILSVQSLITASADNAAMKTLKYTVASTVPIVGGSVSEALSTVSGSISVMKSSVGGFGIAAGAVILAPPVITAVCYRFFLFAAGIVSDLFGCNDTGRIIKSASNVMSVVLAALSCLFVFITIATAILLTFCRS